MKSFVASPANIKKKWYLVDAQGKTLGRLASELASRIRGKHKPEYTPFLDTGDYFIVINANKINVTGKKSSQKIYYRHTGTAGGLKQTVFNKMLAKDPAYIITKAVKGMLPRGPLGRKMLKKLHVYADGSHKHMAQRPEAIEL